MKKLKKVYVILQDGNKEFLGYTNRLYDWFFYAENRRIQPFSGTKDYTYMRNMYNNKYEQFVTYIAE